MAEDQTQTQDAPDQDAHDGEDKHEQHVPYSRFKEVNEKLKQNAGMVEELQSQLQALQDRDKSDVERERDARMRMEQRLAQLENENVAMRKGSWVRSAAAEMNFHDPEDAFSHLREQLPTLEDEREAKRLVKQLAQQKKHLVREKEQERRGPSTLFQGQGVPAQGDQQGGGRRRLTAQELAAQQEYELAQGLAAKLAEFKDNSWQGLGS